MTTLAAVPGMERTTASFRRRLVDIARALRTEPDWIAAVMSRESGVNPRARNPHSGASGLIQFTPQTAKGLGTSTERLVRMSAEEQLSYVERYYRPFRGKLGSAEDVYVAVFLPSHVGRGSSNVIARAGDRVYEINAGLDRDHSGTITNGDIGAAIAETLHAAASRPPVEVPPTPTPATGLGIPAIALGLLALAALRRAP